MINKLVWENLRFRWVRTLLSALVIGVQVMSILTLIGLSRGMLQESATRQRGTGADIFLKPSSGAGVMTFGTGQILEKFIPKILQQPHVVQAVGVLSHPVELITSIQGVDIAQLQKLSGGLKMVSGTLPAGANDLLVDRYYAQQNHVRVGQTLKLANHDWIVSGIMEGGVLGRLIVNLAPLQELTANANPPKVSQILVKIDNPASTKQVVDQLNSTFRSYLQAISMEAFVSQFSISNIPQLKAFIAVITGLAVLVGFLVVFLSMYTAVVERTREIGILKALGAKPGTILNMLVRESLALALLGCAIGILLALAARAIVSAAKPASLAVVNVPDWWPIAAGIAVAGALLGAIYPGLKAARQDAIEALSYE